METPDISLPYAPATNPPVCRHCGQNLAAIPPAANCPACRLPAATSLPTPADSPGTGVLWYPLRNGAICAALAFFIYAASAFLYQHFDLARQWDASPYPIAAFAVGTELPAAALLFAAIFSIGKSRPHSPLWRITRLFCLLFPILHLADVIAWFAVMLSHGISPRFSWIFSALLLFDAAVRFADLLLCLATLVFMRGVARSLRRRWLVHISAAFFSLYALACLGWFVYAGCFLLQQLGHTFNFPTGPIERFSQWLFEPYLQNAYVQQLNWLQPMLMTAYWLAIALTAQRAGSTLRLQIKA